MTNNFFTTYFMALNVAALRRQDDVGEVLVVEEPGEDPQHVALVVVPLEAVLLGPAAHPAFCRYHPETQSIKILSLKTIKKRCLLGSTRVQQSVCLGLSQRCSLRSRP